MNKKMFFLVLFFVVVLISIMIGYGLSHRNLSSHHASISVNFPDSESSDQRLDRYDAVLEAMKTWAEESDMYLVTNPADKGNLSSFASNPDADVRECLFGDTLSSDGPMPLQVMVSFDINELRVVRIIFAQGYSEEPTERLKTISSDLHSRLVKINEQTSYSIW